jgi:putative ABC transport system permease protein
MVLRSLVDRPIRTLLTIAGVALGVPIIVVTLFWRDALDFMIDVQFAAAERAHLIVGFATALPGRAEGEIAHLPGVLLTEAYRAVPVRLRAGSHSYRTALTGPPLQPALGRGVDASWEVAPPPQDGVLLSTRLARQLAVHPGQMVSIEVLDGRRQRLELPLTGELDELLGLGAYARIETLHRLLGEADRITAVGVTVARTDDAALRHALQARPNVVTISDRSVSLRQFRDTTRAFVLVMAGILSAFSVVIAVGVVYNHARVALQERAWELASLRVLGFTRAEVMWLLLSELLIQLLVAVPIGLWLGYWLVAWLRRRASMPSARARWWARAPRRRPGWNTICWRCAPPNAKPRRRTSPGTRRSTNRKPRGPRCSLTARRTPRPPSGRCVRRLPDGCCACCRKASPPSNSARRSSRSAISPAWRSSSTC